MQYEYNADNPNFIGCVHLLEAMCDKGLLNENPDSEIYPNHVLIYRTGLNKKEYGVTEGWLSQNIFDAAQELMEDMQAGDTSLYDALKEQGYKPVFDDSGDFVELSKIDCEKEME